MNKTFFSECRYILLLWSTQALSNLGSAMTNFALVVWSYSQYGSALTTALLIVCAYAPYVLLSIFAGALSDRWDKKKTMLVCDALAALCTLCVLALPALLIPKGGEKALGLVQTCTGLASLAGGALAVALPRPKSRVRVICNSLLFSMSTENFILAFGRGLPAWCIGAVLGWLFIPLMNANMDALFRETIPAHIQGRVYSARNTLQFFTIPVGYLLGGWLVDEVFVPFMATQAPDSLWVSLFGAGKGGGAALFFLVIGAFGALSCLPARGDKHIWALEE